MTKMKKNVIIKSEYIRFLNEIKARIVSARIQATRTLNKELMSLYWDIGKTIAARQESLGWGKSVVNQLSRDLTGEFDNAEGVSPHNLWRMRMFYLTYRNNEKVAQVVLQIPWGHNVVVEYALRSVRNPVGVAEYRLTNKLPEPYKKILPSGKQLIEQIKEEIE